MSHFSRRWPVKDLRRPKPFIKPRKIVLIVCEGEKTEPFYFDALRRELRLTSVEVQICGKECGSAPISVVDFALKKRKGRRPSADSKTSRVPYDVIWCVVDVEMPPHESIERAYDKAIKNKLHVALSNPCFEYWYLLHFERTSRFMQSNHEVLQLLRGHKPDYDKTDKKFFEQVYPQTDIAIINSKQVLKEKLCTESLIAHNPSTHVHLVVEQLMEIASDQ